MTGHAELSRSRKGIVVLVAAVISGGSLWCIATDSDLWPWSNYPMYRELQGDQLVLRRAFAVLRDGREVEFTNEQMRPYSATRMNQLLRRLAKRGDPDRQMRKLLKRVAMQAFYRGGADDIVGARAYTLHWTLLPGAVNRHRPDRRELLAEVVFEDGPESGP
jgi:hypothetical protein